MFSSIIDEARQASIYQAYAASAASYAPSTSRQYPSQIQYSGTKTLRTGKLLGMTSSFITETFSPKLSFCNFMNL